MKSKDRVRAHTPTRTNRQIERGAARRVLHAAAESNQAVTQRIENLDEEWDIERCLEANAAGVAVAGTVLGLLVNRKFFAIPCLVLPFLFQHAIQGWCPSVPILRSKGLRTRREIDAEKYALKALRSDFSAMPADGNPAESARIAWLAANA